MSKELEALERGIIEFEKDLEYDCNNEWLKRVVAGMKKCYQRLADIDNAKPSEALESLEEIGKTLMFTDYETLKSKTLSEVMPNYYRKCKQALIKSQQQEKVLEIIKEKKVNIYFISTISTYDEYLNADARFQPNIVDYMGNYHKEQLLTQEEFDLLKRYFK